MSAPDLIQAIERAIGSFVVHDDHGGPDTEVLADLLPGGYDAQVAMVGKIAQAALAAINSSGSHVVAPVVPAVDMQKAGRLATPYSWYAANDDVTDIYAAMIQAIPKVTP